MQSRSGHLRQRIAALRELSDEIGRATADTLPGPERDELLKLTEDLKRQIEDAETQLAAVNTETAAKPSVPRADYRIFPRPEDDDPV